MNRSAFYDLVRLKSFGLFSGKLSDDQVDGIEAILNAFVKYGDGRKKSLAYILATAYHEVGHNMSPVRETFAKSDAEARRRLRNRSYAKPKNGISYYGRGYVQLTHDYNYKKFGTRYGLNLLGDPDLVLDSDLGARILVDGIIKGDFNGSGKGIAHYLTDSRDDLMNARRTVNVTDRWKTIANYYKKFLSAIDATDGIPTEISTDMTEEAEIEDISGTGSVEDLITTIDPEESLTTENVLLSNKGLKNLPKSRPARKGVVTLATIEKFAKLIPESHRGDSVFVVGVRGYYTDSMGKKGTNDRGIYDDAIFVVEPGTVYNFNGNTDPSRHKAGIANLKAPQAVVYKPGDHGISGPRPYPAFRQESSCTVIRDKKGEDNDTGKNRFWINLHRGGVNTTSSAGCQTVPPHQWNEFKMLVDRLLDEYDQDTFCYLLVDEKDVPSESDVIDSTKQHKKPTKTKPLPEETSDMNSTLVLLIRELLERRKSTLETKPPEDKDADTRKLLNALLLRLVDEDSPLTEKIAEKELPIKNAFGGAIGNLLDGRKTGLGIIGLLATALLPIIFPENGPGHIGNL